MHRLWKKRYGNRGGGDKYYIDCSHYAENSDSIEVKSLLRYISDKNVSILEAVMKDETINSKYRHIVVKIGESNSITKTEYENGETLKNLNGFIKYICLFSCFDDTSDKLKNTKPKSRRISLQNEAVLPKETKICNAEKIDENIKDVLVMPYIKEGPIEKYNWTSENVDILKNLMIHTVLSMAVAFKSVGFIHRDLHLSNVLLKKINKNEKKEIRYEFSKDVIISVPIMGYKVVIMDLEKGELNTNDVYYFWDDLHLVLKNIDGMVNTQNQKVYWKEENQIISFIKKMREDRMPLRNVFKLVDDINNSTLTIKDTNPPLTYNANDVFDFST